MKLNRIAIIATAGAALVGGTGAAVAATSADEPREREQAVLEDAAGRLGTTPDELRDALGAALDAQLDQAVEDGRLTQEQADEIKRHRRQSGTVLGLPGGPGHGVHVRGPLGGPGFVEDVADALGITPRQLFERLHDGRTLAQIAKAEGKTVAEVERAARAAAEARLQESVDDGELTQAQADQLLEHVDEHLDRLGELRGGFGRDERRRGDFGPPLGPPPGLPGG